MKAIRRAIALALAALAVSSAGCAGYKPVRLIRPDIRTVYVEAFDNLTFRRGLEVALTRAIEEEIKLRTPLLLAPREEADSVLSGTLVAFDESTELKSETDIVLINRVSARVRYRWHDRLAGTDIVPQHETGEAVRVAGEFAETLDEAVFRELAQRIVQEMEEPW